MEPMEIEALITLGAWYERFRRYCVQMPELSGVFAEIERLQSDTHQGSKPQAADGFLTLREREYIALRYRAGIARTVIRDELRAQRKDGFSNRHWQELKIICDAIDQEEEAQA